ncbi:ORF432 [White spot syndrome virus]|uniref:ORF432 n=1 Tax=White spot syndrome virus TaxID=342409 RepID=A0A2D3I6X4_9VIRU|nr:ORF432 [White spot syndrome virus]
MVEEIGQQHSHSTSSIHVKSVIKRESKTTHFSLLKRVKERILVYIRMNTRQRLLTRVIMILPQ